jgi:hypothetical protein
MRANSLRFSGVLAAAAAAVLACPQLAHGQGALLDDDIDPAAETSAASSNEPEGARYGIGFRLRQIHLPEGLIELFVEDAAGGGVHTGIGGELIRQKGNFVITLGFEYENLSATDGVWIDKGDMIPQDEPDFVEFDNFGWYAIDATFIWQTDLHRMLSLRYGAGIGVGIITGDVLRTDFVCTDSNVDSCMESPTAVNVRTPEEDIPPVFPIVNVVVGLQLRPVGNLHINIEGGIRTLPFFGATVGYMF